MSRIAPRMSHIDVDPDRGYQIRYNRHPKRTNNFKIAEMYDCYRDGMSLATIAKLYCVSRQSVYSTFSSRGYRLRTKKLKGARIIDGVAYTFDGQGYLRGTKDGKRVYLHKLVWQRANGPVPNGFQLHFKDGNKENCHIENLELVPFQQLSKTFNPNGRNQYSI